MSGLVWDPNCLTRMLFLKEIFENFYFEQNQQTTKKHAKLLNISRTGLTLNEHTKIAADSKFCDISLILG